MPRKKAEPVMEEIPILSVETTRPRSKPLGSVTFSCPQCGKQEITRSFHERQLATKYVCRSCGFEGPN